MKKKRPKPERKKRRKAVTIRKKQISETELKKREMRRARRKIRIKRRATVFLFMFVCAAVVIFVLKAPMFNIKSVMCVGTENITQEELIKAAGVKTGENIFAANIGMMKKQLSAMPEIAESNVRRIFPNKIKIWVREAEPAAFVISGGEAAIIDRNGRVIRCTDQKAEELSAIAELTGPEVVSTTPGESIAADGDLKAEKVFECIGIMSELGMLGKIQYIDANDLSDIRFGYENRLRILLGGYDKMDYKLKFIKTVIDDKLSPYESANLDYTGDKLYVGPLETENDENAGEEENVNPADKENTEDKDSKENTDKSEGGNENGAAAENGKESDEVVKRDAYGKANKTENE